MGSAVVLNCTPEIEESVGGKTDKRISENANSEQDRALTAIGSPDKGWKQVQGKRNKSRAGALPPASMELTTQNHIKDKRVIPTERSQSAQDHELYKDRPEIQGTTK